MRAIMAGFRWVLVCGMLSAVIALAQALPPVAALPQETVRHEIISMMQREFDSPARVTAGVTVIQKGDALVPDAELFEDQANRTKVALVILAKLTNPTLLSLL